MERNETAQYITRPKYPSPGFLYERTFDLSNKDWSRKIMLDMTGYNELGIDVFLSADAAGSTPTIAWYQTNGWCEDLAELDALGDSGPMTPDTFSFQYNITARAAKLLIDIAGTLGDEGKLTIRVCGSK